MSGYQKALEAIRLGARGNDVISPLKDKETVNIADKKVEDELTI